MLAISLSSTEWRDVFSLAVYLKTPSIVAIFYKDLWESVFEKTLVSQLGGECSSQLRKTHNKAAYICIFQSLWTFSRGKFKTVKWHERVRVRWEVYEMQPVREMYGCRSACVNHSQQVRRVKAAVLVMVNMVEKRRKTAAENCSSYTTEKRAREEGLIVLKERKEREETGSEEGNSPHAITLFLITV